jgi:hypothetical protein
LDWEKLVSREVIVAESPDYWELAKINGVNRLNRYLVRSNDSREPRPLGKCKFKTKLRAKSPNLVEQKAQNHCRAKSPFSPVPQISQSPPGSAW